jgi:hypothetical protein
MKVWMLFLLFSLSAFSAEFTHIKLTPEFETQISRRPDLDKSLRTTTLSGPSLKIFALLGRKDITQPIPVDGQNSPLYEEIRRHLEASHQSIGAEEARNIMRMNQQFNLGTSNFSGFSWQRPFGAVQVYVDRQVTPNLFGDNWLVQDSFTITLEASSFLERANTEGITNMSDSEIASFAGITFSRVFTYYHYANSYQEGLQANFSKLFLPFTKFNQRGIEEMSHEEILKREDNWTARTGGLISTPPLYNISFSGGVLAEYDFQERTSIETSQTKEPGEHRYKVGVLAKKSASAGASLELQLDFFKFLKLTILRYDLNYEYSSGKEFTLGFTQDQWTALKKAPEKNDELNSILTGLGGVKVLEPYVVRLDESSSEEVAQRGSILLWGKLQKSKTEQVRVIKDQSVHLFFKNYAQNVKVVQNLLSRLFSALVYKLLKLPLGVSNAAIYSRQMTLEYEATHPQASDPNLMRIESSEQFSFVLNQYYNAARTDRWLDRRFKNDVIWFVDNFTTLTKDYKTSVRQEQLKGPLIVESNLRVEKEGFVYLLSLSENFVFGAIAKVCDSKKKDEWTQAERRQVMLEDTQFGNESCVKTIGRKFLGFRQDYLANHLKPSLAKFKDFLGGYYKESGNLADLQVLFGEANTFIHGKLQATTGSGNPFVTTFSSGQFRGLGVIDNFKRGTGSRAPASILSE